MHRLTTLDNVADRAIRIGHLCYSIGSLKSKIKHYTAWHNIHFSCASVPQPGRRETTVYLLSACTAYVFALLNKKTTLVCLHGANTYVNCLPTSLLDHFKKTFLKTIYGWIVGHNSYSNTRYAFSVSLNCSCKCVQDMLGHLEHQIHLKKL